MRVKDSQYLFFPPSEEINGILWGIQENKGGAPSLDAKTTSLRGDAKVPAACPNSVVGCVVDNEWCCADLFGSDDHTTNSKSIVFFSAQNEIFSIDRELYVGISEEKLKCQKDFLQLSIIDNSAARKKGWQYY
jgi:hypothetical protein